MNNIPKEKLVEMKSYPIHIRLQILRGWTGFTQLEFADFLGISKATVSHWERGFVYPSSKNLMKIVQAFELPYDVMFSTENEQNV